MEQPSGLSDEPGIRPEGSLVTGIPALLNALRIVSLTSACLDWRPALLMHDKPCAPLASTCLPHMHVNGMHRLAPSRSPVATRMASLSSLKPSDDDGMTLSQSPA